MNRFDDLLQRVRLLHSQLEPLRNHVGSETRMILHRKLWGIVEDLNTMLDLGLDNTALDLTVDGDRLLIHYRSGVEGSVEPEINVYIDRSFAVQKLDLSPHGKVETGRERQRRAALNDPNEGI